MRIILSFIILIFSSQTFSNANDIKEFEIEGMSIGDSLLNFVSKKSVKTQIEDKRTSVYYDNDYVSIVLKDMRNKLSTYEDVKAIAEKAMKNKLIDVVNLEHDMDETIDAYMTKSWLVEDTENDLSNKYGMNLPEGSWVAEYKIEDKKVWEDIKAGIYKGFSIEGIFQNNIVNAA